MSRLSYSISTAAEETGLHRHTISKAVRLKKLQARRLGRRVVILHEDLVDWLRGLPSYREDEDDS